MSVHSSAVCGSLLVFCWAAGVKAQTVTVSVAGVVIDKDSQRLPDIPVRLHGGAEISRDVTRRGVYNLTATGVDAQTRKLLVRCNQSGYDESFVEADLDGAIGGVSRSKAPDITLFCQTPSKSTRSEASGRLANAIRTETLKVRWELASPVQAHKELTAKAAVIAAAIPEDVRKDWAGLLNDSLEREPSKAIPFDRNQLLKLPQQDEFKRALQQEKTRLDTAHFDIDRVLDGRPDVQNGAIDKVLTIPGSSIPIEWLRRPAIKGQLPEIAKEYDGGTKRYVFNSREKWTAENVAPLVEGNDQKKLLLLYEGLKRSPGVSEEDRRKLDARIELLVPQIRSKP